MKQRVTLMFSAPCPYCAQEYERMGTVPQDKHLYWQKRLPNGKQRHKTPFGRAFHKRAVKNFQGEVT